MSYQVNAGDSSDSGDDVGPTPSAVPVAERQYLSDILPVGVSRDQYSDYLKSSLQRLPGSELDVKPPSGEPAVVREEWMIDPGENRPQGITIV